MTNNKNYTMIYYHIPQDLDNPETPNAYTYYILNHIQNIPLNISEIIYTDIVKTFPIKGKFIFYFLCLHQKEQMWMEITSNQVQLPIVNKHIQIRAERRINDNDVVIKESEKKLSDLIQF